MTLQIPSVQVASAALHAAPTLPFIAPMAHVVEQGFSLAKKYCFERSVLEFLVKATVATTIVAMIYFGHALLVGMALLWCLAMLSIAAYRLLSSRSAHEEELDTEVTDALQEDADASEAYMSELSDALV